MNCLYRHRTKQTGSKKTVFFISGETSGEFCGILTEKNVMSVEDR